MLSGSEILSLGDLSLLESEEQSWGEGITLREHFTQDVSINGSRAVNNANTKASMDMSTRSQRRTYVQLSTHLAKT